MKKLTLLLFLWSLAGVNSFLFAQGGDDRRAGDDKRKIEFEQFKVKRIEFITKEIDLTEDEAKVFWPICNELQEKKFEINKQLRDAVREFFKQEKKGKKHSESDYKKLVDLHVNVKVKEAQLEEQYVEKFAKVISAEKIFRYQHAEQEFARKMLDQREKRPPRD
jgi:Spy/CpxP family protein refolding chaperone